jgi:hypothetical protein
MLAGKLSAEEVKAAFGAIGYTPDIKWTTVTPDEPTISKSTSTHKVTQNGEVIGEYTVETTTEDYPATQVPYIAGESTMA